MSTLGLFVAAFVVLLAVFGALVRTLSWRATAVLAAVLGAVAAMGVFTAWQVQEHERREGSDFGASAMGGWVEDGPDGTRPWFHGRYVLPLAIVGSLTALGAASRDSATRSHVWGPRCRVGAIANSAALAVVAYDLAFNVDSPHWWYVPSDPPYHAGYGILLTTVAAFFGAACAWATFLKIRPKPSAGGAAPAER